MAARFTAACEACGSWLFNRSRDILQDKLKTTRHLHVVNAVGQGCAVGWAVAHPSGVRAVTSCKVKKMA